MPKFAEWRFQKGDFMKNKIAALLCLILTLATFSVCFADESIPNIFPEHISSAQGITMTVSTGYVKLNGRFDGNGALSKIADGDRVNHCDVYGALDWSEPSYVGVVFTLDNDYYCEKTTIYSGYDNYRDTYKIYASANIGDLYDTENIVAENVVCGNAAVDVAIGKNIRYIAYICTAYSGNQRVKEFELYGTDPVEEPEEPAVDTGVRTEGTNIIVADRVKVLRGVNVPQFSWSSYGDGSTSSGNSNAHHALNTALSDWKCDIIRLPVDPDVYLNGGTGSGSGQSVYRTAQQYRNLIDYFVTTITSAGTPVILDCHAYSGVYDNVENFWEIAAPYYDGNELVMYGLLNEPISDWQIYYEGGTVTVPGIGEKTSIGMTALLDNVRELSDNVVVIGGIDWAFNLSGLTNDGFEALANTRASALSMTAEQYTETYSLFTEQREGRGIVLDTHLYSNKRIDWDVAIGAAVKERPVIVGEYNPYYRSGFLNDLTDREKAFYNKLFSWMEDNDLSSTAWSLGAEPFLTNGTGNSISSLGTVVKDYIATGSWSFDVEENLIFEKLAGYEAITKNRTSGRLKYENTIFSMAYNGSENIGSRIINDILDGNMSSHDDIFLNNDKYLGIEFTLNDVYAANKITLSSGFSGYEDHYYIYASDSISDLYTSAKMVENATTDFAGTVSFNIDRQIKYVAILTVGEARIRGISVSGVRLGDISGDHHINAYDITGLVTMLIDPEGSRFLSSGDLNRDRYTNILDLILLKRKTLNS